jgi:hypothetical protein
MVAMEPGSLAMDAQDAVLDQAAAPSACNEAPSTQPG